MRHLPLPATPAQDDAVVQRLAGSPPWAPHAAPWLQAYAEYRQHAGNPFVVSPHNFGPGVATLQYNLYDSRKRSGALARMRRQSGLLSCPVCGSPVTGHLDHHLPRAVYPEFAIMRVNLVPACSHCNSGVKGDTVHGDEPERFIHPYFDQWASDTIWTVEIVRPLDAATFRAVPVAGLPHGREEIVRFHLDHVLGDQFQRSMENEWSTYPLQIAIRRPAPQLADVVEQIDADLRVAIVSKGNNSWPAAFFSGLAADAEAVEYVRLSAATTLLP
jgi:hypothetical protein